MVASPRPVSLSDLVARNNDVRSIQRPVELVLEVKNKKKNVRLLLTARDKAARRRPQGVTDSLDGVGHSDEAAVLPRHVALHENKLSYRVQLRISRASTATHGDSQFDATVLYAGSYGAHPFGQPAGTTSTSMYA